MRRVVHFARLESPSEALRCACGAWREGANWTTVPELVTCPECLRRLADGERPSARGGGVGLAR